MPLSHNKVPDLDQEIKSIQIKDLVLWTENPRDDIDENATDQTIADIALKDLRSKWSLPKLAQEMGDYYDLSELPTVVYHGTKPVVYDGNRRVILGKIKLGLIQIKPDQYFDIPNYPNEIPCNVCSKKVALINVKRKHIDNGSWDPLERDIFLHKQMGDPKSNFLILEEDTGLITSYPHLNQRFVKEEVFNEDNLHKIGFEVKNGKLHTSHNTHEAKSILSDIADKVLKKVISTRHNRGKVAEVLNPINQETIDQNKNKQSHLTQFSFLAANNDEKTPRQSRRTVKKITDIFGSKLYLKHGDVSDLYRDIVDLYKFYVDQKEILSESFPAVIRMSLRLICETAQKDVGKSKLEDYLMFYFETAKRTLSQDLKTTLSNQNVTERSITQLLHTGAHTYKASANMDQTMAMSIIIGAILSLSHGKE
ncbi:hypothetical protein [Mucilaginibacter sp. 44-25]|uniref:hypothetical protein n=1 Tax=Mucilaginibacter sp. 44-25 TaxID=1895794 RepID=UPI00095FA10D|nr:hypothetical protein [Mucilaginibacter sp. 44-25]OJW15283.1 MAG: hypothetical protein BGO48_14225 [Mucilaginibacter sp. 44-25]